jgi:hypothetical protein
MRGRSGGRTPTDAEIIHADAECSRAAEAALGVDTSTYAKMMARHGLYAAWSGVDDGWVPLVDRLLTELEALGWNGTVLGVKEKFGLLRFYFNHTRYEWQADPTAPQGGEWAEVAGTPEGADRAAIKQLVEAAEAASSTICERCGAPGELRLDGDWFLTGCALHARPAVRATFTKRSVYAKWMLPAPYVKWWVSDTEDGGV